MSWLSRLFGLGRRKSAPKSPGPVPGTAPQPVAPPTLPTLPLGINVHTLTPAAIAWCVRAGVRQVRTTVYAGYDLAVYDAGIAAAQAAGLDVLAVVHGGGDPEGWVRQLVAGAARWPWLAWQLGNECDAAVSADEYVALFRAVRVEAPGAVLVSAGCGGPDAALYARALDEADRAARTGARYGALCAPSAYGLHAYGPPPSGALYDRAAQFNGMPARTLLWCTEFGIAAKDAERAWQLPAAEFPERQRQEWERVAQMATYRPLSVGRAYGYCYDAHDEYGIEGTPTADWLARTQGGDTHVL